jgi:hypothetical protein
VRLVTIAAALALSLSLSLAAGAGAEPPARASLTGKIAVLKPTAITLHGSRSLTCRITTSSPRVRLLGFSLGSKATVICLKGVLSKIVRPVTPALSEGSSADATEPETGTGGVKIAPTVNGTAAITALGGGAIEFGGAITCQLGSRSPSVGAYRVGSRVSYTCAAGTLTAIGVGAGA